jgi:hypothetical protein
VAIDDLTAFIGTRARQARPTRLGRAAHGRPHASPAPNKALNLVRGRNMLPAASESSESRASADASDASGPAGVATVLPRIGLPVNTP